MFLARSLRSRFLCLQQSLLKLEIQGLKEIKLDHPTEEIDSNLLSPVSRKTSEELITSPRSRIQVRSRTQSFQGQAIDLKQESLRKTAKGTLTLDLAGVQKTQSANSESFISPRKIQNILPIPIRTSDGLSKKKKKKNNEK